MNIALLRNLPPGGRGTAIAVEGERANKKYIFLIRFFISFYIKTKSFRINKILRCCPLIPTIAGTARNKKLSEPHFRGSLSFLFCYHVTTHCANNITSGSVAVERIEVIPTDCEA